MVKYWVEVFAALIFFFFSASAIAVPTAYYIQAADWRQSFDPIFLPDGRAIYGYSADVPSQSDPATIQFSATLDRAPSFTSDSVATTSI
jgi:hypothetical protein